jgi:hypothetical protein
MRKVTFKTLTNASLFQIYCTYAEAILCFQFTERFQKT